MTVSDSRLRHTRLLDDSALSALEVDNDCAIIINLLTYLLREFHTLPRMWSIRYLECGPMPNVMAALPNIGGSLCSLTPQCLADAH